MRGAQAQLAPACTFSTRLCACIDPLRDLALHPCAPVATAALRVVVVEKKLSFRSKALDTDDAYSYTFATAGSFDYFCSLHPHMVGKIIVK